MKTLYILKYNNYYNRILKKEDSLEAYLEYDVYTAQNINFNPNDGVNTTHIIGGASASNSAYNGEGDYLLVINEDETIDSRWFIIEQERTRAGQHSLTLHRDLLVDFYDEVINSPCFIEKATLPDSSPLIYNSEQMSVNQIKTKETLIKDRSHCSWIVGYYAKNYNTPQDQPINLSRNLDYFDIQLETPIENWEYYRYQSEDFIGDISDIRYRIYGTKYKEDTFVFVPIPSAGYIDISIDNNNEETPFSTDSSPYTQSFGDYSFNLNGSKISENLMKYLNEEKDYWFSQLYNLVPNSQFASSGNEERFKDEADYQIIRDSNGRYFETYVVPYSTGVSFTGDLNNQSGVGLITLQQLVASYNEDQRVVKEEISGSAGDNSFKVYITRNAYRLIINEITPEGQNELYFTVQRQHTEDAPYDIFAIPMGEIELATPSGTIGISDPTDSIFVAQKLVSALGDNLYDIQILPYCPYPDIRIYPYADDVLRKGFTKLTIYNQDSEVIYFRQDDLASGQDPRTRKIGFLLNIPYARFSKTVINKINYTNKKISNECDFYRLASPNWASDFHINLAKNGGIDSFDIDCEYKPFQPYIHVAPNFKELYGKDFNDARGLILSGDFSITQLRDRWQDYQINNKNFQNIFDRQIENMEVQHKYQRIQQIAGITTGSIGGTTAGAMTGVSMGGPVGAIAGGVIGGAASTAGGIIDYRMSESLRNEAIDYSKDLFGYQLDNIKALPYTLTKVSAYNPNNKIFPVLEYYTCTNTEKKAMANKIAYNGMTVGVIGKISDYLNTSWSYYDPESEETITDKGYIKGQLIRLENLHDDFHLVNSIAAEINKGVYTK